MLNKLRKYLSRIYSSRAVLSKTSLATYLSRYKSYPTWSIGNWSYGNPRIVGEGQALLTIGNFVSIADKVTIFLGHEHHIDRISTYPFCMTGKSFLLDPTLTDHPKTKGDVVIGSDVWIGYGATLLSGLSVGHGAVIGASSLVTKDVPPFAVVGGNPATILKYRFPPHVIHALLESCWWEWQDETIRQNISLFYSTDMDFVVARLRKILHSG